jgi:hypothetical protein
MVVPVHKDLQDEKTTDPESTERSEGVKGGNEGRKRLNLIFSQNEGESNQGDVSGQQYGKRASK